MAVKPVLIVVMGVSGTGKSTLGKALANSYGFPFIDGDDLHPKSNVEKMSAGFPLTDTDREPWLELIRTTVEHKCVELEHHQRGQEGPTTSETNGPGNDERRRVGVVVGCSALKKYYRDILRGKRKEVASDEAVLPEHLEPPHSDLLPTFFVFIKGQKQVLFDRMQNRKGHFMKASMLESQLNTLEDPEGEDGVVVVNLEDSTEQQVAMARERLEDVGI
ncbi:carbohydrate kinase [Dendrothele bispora CBS 962.96]|uniref:gluconokinase n=1 Tax=Dendrothele bispora (strain CBS 962.96) TaxID=1314807 RepID=A0A4V6T548_DENBC|nr:carbohydrate kinase [Dendrothele bispora CBS 962.96]